MRMLSGILAAQPFTSEMSGDSSLVKRPMRRIIAPLRQMGARIDAFGDQFPPLTIHGSPLQAIDYILPVPSAQVKSWYFLPAFTRPARQPFANRLQRAIIPKSLFANWEPISPLSRAMSGSVEERP